MISGVFVAVLALPILALASPAPSNGSALPPCSNVDRPCSCPAGTQFKNVTTYGIIGAPASDVAAVMNHFFDTDWTGLPPVSVTGTDDVVGATRTFNITANGTSYELTEKLIEWSSEPDGSFSQRYRQNPTPPVVTLPAAQGGYSYHGYWATLKGQQTLVHNETAILYNVYRCDIGVPFNTAPAHDSSVANVSSTLGKLGELTGVSITPFSTLSLIAG